jgi:hypothetical protein
MRVVAAHLAVALYSPVHSSGAHGPEADKAVKDFRNAVMFLRGGANFELYVPNFGNFHTLALCIGS